MRILFLFLTLACVGLAYAGDGLLLVPYRRDRVRFKVEPLEPNAAKSKAAVPALQLPIREQAGFVNPEKMIAGEICRWLTGSVTEAPISREPFASGSLGRWVSFDGMSMPRVQVSKFSGATASKAGSAVEKRD